MAEGEKFSLVKFFKSFFQWLPWVKDLRTICTIVILVFVGFTIYRAYFVKAQQQTQKIVIQKGASAVIQQKQEIPKRSWWIPSPYVRINTFTKTNGEKGLGTEFGAEWKW